MKLHTSSTSYKHSCALFRIYNSALDPTESRISANTELHRYVIIRRQTTSYAI